MLVCTSDRGLAGAYTANVIKEAERVLSSVRERGLEPVLYVSGKKGVGYFRFRGVPIEADWQGHTEVPPYEVAQEIGTRLIDDFAAGTIDELYCAYTDFRSAFTLRATAQAVPADRPARGDRRRRDARCTPSTCSSRRPSASSTTCCRST